MIKTLILYESKYGFTEKISKYLSQIIGPAKYCKLSELNFAVKDYEFIVICSPVYMENIESNILQYVSENADWIKEKKVALICTCLSERMGDKYLKPLKSILGQSCLYQSAIQGELILNKLDSSDSESIKRFSQNTGIALNDYRLFDINKFIEAALAIKKIKDEGKDAIDEKILRRYIYDFILKHNTCTLATGRNENIRATPIEYIYKDGCFYFLSEGGEKFANILINKNVSICIYDPFKNMRELGGMQVTGSAEVIDIWSDEYISVLSHKGLDSNKLASLPVILNLIKVSVEKIEFLSSEFIKMGYNSKQILYKD